MQSGSKLDSQEQRRLGQLINVTNTWSGKAKLRLLTQEPCLEIRKMLSCAARPSKGSSVMPSRIQFLFLFTVDSLTLPTSHLFLCHLHSGYFLMATLSLENKLHQICKAFSTYRSCEALDSLWKERCLYKHQRAIIHLPTQGEAISVVPSAHFQLLLLVYKTKHLSSYLKVIPIGRDREQTTKFFLD